MKISKQNLALDRGLKTLEVTLSQDMSLGIHWVFDYNHNMIWSHQRAVLSQLELKNDISWSILSLSDPVGSEGTFRYETSEVGSCVFSHMLHIMFPAFDHISEDFSNALSRKTVISLEKPPCWQTFRFLCCGGIYYRLKQVWGIGCFKISPASYIAHKFSRNRSLLRGLKTCLKSESNDSLWDFISSHRN